MAVIVSGSGSNFIRWFLLCSFPFFLASCFLFATYKDESVSLSSTTVGTSEGLTYLLVNSFCSALSSKNHKPYLRWKSNGGNLREDRSILVSSHARLKMKNLGHYSILSLFLSNVLHVSFNKPLHVANTKLAIARHRLSRKRTQSDYLENSAQITLTRSSGYRT